MSNNISFNQTIKSRKPHALDKVCDAQFCVIIHPIEVQPKWAGLAIHHVKCRMFWIIVVLQKWKCQSGSVSESQKGFTCTL